jgi:hypothetical protein
MTWTWLRQKSLTIAMTLVLSGWGAEGLVFNVPAPLRAAGL